MNALLADLYQFSMLQGYLEEGMDELACFELFVRRLPPERNFLVAAGLEQALDFLEQLAFDADDIDWLDGVGGFSPAFLQRLRSLRFEGDVHAMPEGSVFFANEPILRVSAPLPQAQLVESRLLNIVHFQTLIASKAARMVLAARGRGLVDFGMRRAHGADAALLAARAAWLAGFDGSATVEAGRRFGIPVFGTMAHSYVQAHASERDAFLAFARTHRRSPTLLVDTYDTQRAVATVVALAPVLAREGITVGGIRIDSGDLAAHAKAARVQLDRGGLHTTRIVASGNLDEAGIARLLADGAPIDSFGVGTALTTSSDLPALDAVYKLQRYAGVARRKRSEGKVTWPGIKQVMRWRGPQGRLLRDRVQLADEPAGDRPPGGQALLQPCMIGGRRCAAMPDLAAARERCGKALQALPETVAGLAPAAPPYEVALSDGLRALARAMDAQDG